jgi:hypothetical protein
MVCVRAMLQQPGFYGSLIVAVKSKTKYRLQAAAMLSFSHTIQNVILTKDEHF